MRRAMLWAGIAAVASVAAVVYGCGETAFGTCADNGMCPVPGADATAQSPDGGDDAGGSQGTTSDAGSDGSPGDGAAGSDGATCDPTADPSTTPCVVSDAYGVFVSASASGAGTGQMASPYSTIAAGISAAAASSKRVFVCAGTYPEQLVVGTASDGIAVYGGFDCTNWSYGSSNSVKVAPAQPGYALEVDSLTIGATFEDMEFDAQDAQDAGTSSIAVFANQTVVTFRRVVMKAGNGAAGAAGAAGVNYPVDAGRAANGNSADGSAGGLGILCTCLNGDQSVGGAGGVGTTPPSQGAEGEPYLDAGQPGLPGSGTCSNGGHGAGTGDVPGGVGATADGVLSPPGWTPSVADAGATASVAQGGGGGGGGSGVASAGGGASGGCGGCGGGGGGGGGAGGSSFALLSYLSTVTLDTCQLSAGSPGQGGTGGAGQPGQAGGLSGDQSNPGCPGGTGGSGGGGGGGGGGAGGLSAAIAYTPPAPTGLDAGVTTQVGEAGAGGAGGAGGGASNAGGSGINGTAGPIIQL